MRNIRGVCRAAVLATASLHSGILRNTGTHMMHSKDQQFVSMVLMDILLYVVFCSMAVIFLTHQQMTQFQEKYLEQVQIDIFLK